MSLFQYHFFRADKTLNQNDINDQKEFQEFSLIASCNYYYQIWQYKYRKSWKLENFKKCKREAYKMSDSFDGDR